MPGFIFVINNKKKKIITSECLFVRAKNGLEWENQNIKWL